jgi:catechol 2,3-dioxygenase-like lactoylglutathione lyase family enzyme
VASGRIGGVAVDFVQPAGGENAYSAFLKKHGSGIFSLLHKAPSPEEFDRELARFEETGVGVLQSGAIETGGASVRYAFLDTEQEGKYALGLYTVSGAIEESPIFVPPEEPSGLTIAQYAFVARDFDRVSKFWSKLGLPALSVTHNPTTDLRYRGRPAEFDMKLGWQRHGKVTYEWILSLQGPNVYLDHLEKHGEGIHHIAFNVDDMDKAIARWTELGFSSTQSGGWGDKGKPGSGRFSYHDTQAIGGIDVELLWSFR